MNKKEEKSSKFTNLSLFSQQNYCLYISASHADIIDNELKLFITSKGF